MNKNKLEAYQKIKQELGIRTALDTGFEPDFLSGGALREKGIRGEYTIAEWREMRTAREKDRLKSRDRKKSKH